jgi:hypothetical protein
LAKKNTTLHDTKITKKLAWLNINHAKMIRNLLPNADAASGTPAFTSEEFDDLFNIPSNNA